MTNRIDCDPKHLVIYDPLGRPVKVDWNHLLLVSAGHVVVTELKRVECDRSDEDENDEEWKTREFPTTEYKTEEQRNVRLLLELFLTGARVIYTVNVESKMPFRYLGSRVTGDVGSAITMVMQDLAKIAPQTVFNRGAFCFREQVPHTWNYPSKNAFANESSWLLWQLKKAGRI
jgi:hypothetical protein